METQTSGNQSPSEALLPEPRHLSASSATQWWRDAWEGFKADVSPWVLTTILMVLVSVVSSWIAGESMIMGVVVQILSFVLYAGLLIGAHDSYFGKDMKVSYLIEGFYRRPAAVAGLALLFVLIWVAVLVAAVFLGVMAFAAVAAGNVLALILMIVALALGALLTMAFWFAPVLLVLHPQVDVLRAMKMSFAGCLDNILPMFVYGLWFILFAIVATIPLGLGWLVLIPLSILSTYVAYRQIFLVEPERAPDAEHDVQIDDHSL